MENNKKINKKFKINQEDNNSLEFLDLKSVNNLQSLDKSKDRELLFKKPSPIEYSNFFRPGMGTENVGSFLRSLIMMFRPNRILEIGAGYTTPFLLEGLINNQRVFDDGNLQDTYFERYTYDPKLVIVDNQSLGDLIKMNGMQEIINSKFTEFVEGSFEGNGTKLFKKYGFFDFVWFDCGGPIEYENFIKEYFDYCSNYILFHFTYSNGKKNINHKIIRENINEKTTLFDIVEPHKKRQGSITILKKGN